ncbi:ABC transporter ATP-binding protein [Phytoactinopolyspora limicola]|uniref:ABC transporter ATP-binding protein n=1 Tax=Phytoactinopolyspora limicola TaxID=2715536 RepID=UPI001408FFE1|nr:ABC transporter ATP-binding protein [Phytoactinopolyspora limicola]
MSAAPVLDVENVTKIYHKKVWANDHVSLTISAGDVYGLLGHNGAGKTTLLNQVVGLAKPTEGKITLNGRDAVADPAYARKMCAMQPQSQAPLDGVTPKEAIELMARIRGASRRDARRRTADLMAALDIEPWADTKGEKLSGGVQRLTAFAMAAAEPGRLAMFDEPTNDVDPVRRRLLWAQVRELADQGCAVLLVTHNVIEAERTVDRLAILDHGRVVVHGTPTELRGEHAHQLRLEAAAISHAVAQDLAHEFDNARSAVAIGRRMIAPVAADDCATALQWAQRHQQTGRIDEFSFNPVSLEDIYIRLVGSPDDNVDESDDALLAT